MIRSPLSRPVPQRGVTTLLAMIVLAALILGGTVGAWMRVISTRTSGQSLSSVRSTGCAETGLNAARAVLFNGAGTLPPLPSPSVPQNVQYTLNVVSGMTWQQILTATGGARAFLIGALNPPASFTPATALGALAQQVAPYPNTITRPLSTLPVATPPAATTRFEVTLSNNRTEVSLWGNVPVQNSVQDTDGLYVLTVTCSKLMNGVFTPDSTVQRYVRHPASTLPGGGSGATAP